MYIPALGHGRVGISTPWIGLELEQDKRPTVRPWKLPLKAKMESLGDPGDSSKQISEKM